MSDQFTMREPCSKCGETNGQILERNGQDVVRCSNNHYCYCAPRTETGRKQRSVSTVHAGIKPKQRARILARASARCEVCGARGNLHVGHMISVDVGMAYGLTDEVINDDENLLCLCEECNLGWGNEPMPLRVAITVLKARISWRDANEGSS